MITVPPAARRLICAMLIAFAILSAGALAPATAAEDVREIIKTVLELRRDIRTGIGTWKTYGHAAADLRDDRTAYTGELADRIQQAYNRGALTSDHYMRLLELRHRLNDAAQREYKERRALNQRMMIRARKSEVFSRLPVLKLARKKWVYTMDRAEQAINGSNTLQAIAAEIEALKQEAEKALASEAQSEAKCDEARKKSLESMITDYNTKWDERWCSPIWSGCGSVALHEANGLRYSLAGASTSAQCDWVVSMAACKDSCVMNYIGDAGAAQRDQCLRDCMESLPYPQ
jgi:hypothetical protein